MLKIKTPEIYLNEPGAINSLGSLVSPYGKRALIIWSKTARKVTEEAVIESLGVQRIHYMEYRFEGYPTLEKAEDIVSIALGNSIDILIAIGGGRVMDTVKAAGDISSLPVVAVPTIAATCAAWAALSVLYTEEGDFHHFRHNRQSPKLIVADTKILSEAPIRFLRAGVVDTLAKWYETSIHQSDSFSYLNSVHSARLAFDFLFDHGAEVIEASANKKVDENIVKAVDAILYLAGDVGSYAGEKAYSGFAHPFYHSSRIIKETRKTLHGEVVSFGLIMQAVLEKKSKDQIKEIVKKFQELKVAFTLEEIGIYDQVESKLKIISDRIYKVFPDLLLLEENTVDRAIIDAAFEADAYVKSVREEREKVYG
ncbi:iron-containing alcohol dehydrogenase family protein [Lacrimispora sp.]|jgi:glycerol dehydrogenase|uniref:iron-containing alcohol dehydrogenase family protein n=1 Tax=Lacrimispora sp. TaxID=2719234 RepID=UPI0028B14B7C|nr:iron-containing alcohol dehydrogenase family protein [Lacrimispora sp.]